MASDAEIDLIVDASGTLPQLQRDLERIISTAEDGADTVDLDASLDASDSLSRLSSDLDTVVARASAGASNVDLDAVLDTSRTASQLHADLSGVLARAQRGADRDPVTLEAVLDRSGSLARVQDELDDVVDRARATAGDIDVDVDVDTDRARQSLRRFLPDLDEVGRTALRTVASLGSVSAGILGTGAAASSVVPVLAGAVAVLESIAPAAAVGTQAMLAQQLVAGTLKLGMMGVEEAIEAAFDPDADPAALAAAMKNLAPEAKAFVQELQGMKSEFKALRLDVQNRLFRDMDESVKTLSRSALPQVGDALGRTADAMNAMAKGAVSAASELAANGTLGKALEGATKGIENLVDVPGQAVTAFGQLAAAAAPAFDRITKAVARVADEVSDRLNKAFESGALEDAINGAIDVIKQLGRIAVNVFGALKNLISGVDVEGAGLFGTLEKITQSLQDVTGSDTFQKALSELSKTMGALAENAVPLFTSALETIAEVIAILAPPARELIDVLGDNLSGILEAAKEPLKALADAFGELVTALSPIIDLAGELIVAVLPALTPLFTTLKDIIVEAAPVVKQLAENIGEQLTPVLERLPEILEIILPPFAKLAEEVFPLLLDMLVEMEPSLRELSTALGDLLVELAPVVAKAIEFGIAIVEKVMPYIGPVLVGLISGVASVLSFMADIITSVVLPALRGISKLLKGDVTGALAEFDTAVGNTNELVARAFNAMLVKVGGIMDSLINRLTVAAAESGDRLADGIQRGIDRMIREVAGIPQRVIRAVGNLSGILYGAGQSVIEGFLSGIRSQIGRIQDLLNGVTAMIPDWKGPAETDARLLTENGRLIMQSLIDGFDDVLPEVRATLTGVTNSIPGTVGVPAAATSTPVIHVTIGNQAVDQYVTTRVRSENADRERTMAQGVRW